MAISKTNPIVWVDQHSFLVGGDVMAIIVEEVEFFFDRRIWFIVIFVGIMQIVPNWLVHVVNSNPSPVEYKAPCVRALHGPLSLPFIWTGVIDAKNQIAIAQIGL